MRFEIDRTIDFILSGQNADGSFSTYESYPVVKPQDGWTILPDTSPFITSNILYSLMMADNERFSSVIKKGVNNLLKIKEGHAYWRFWPADSKQHQVPFDIDDTCVASFIVAKAGIKLSNKILLLNNKNDEGYLETWLTPRLKMFFTEPSGTFELMEACIKSLPTYKLGHFTFRDFEPAVAANALLYLGENESTEKCIDLIIKEVKNGTMPYQFYDNEVVVYYHISRAFVNGIKKFKELKETITSRVIDRFSSHLHSHNAMISLMAANVLLDYNSDIGLAQKLINAVAERESFPDKWQCCPYFASKDRNFLSGSPEFTAALFVEACSKLDA